MKKKAAEIPHTGYKCAAGGCRQPGDYKAPRSRWLPGDYQYFCLDHVREFNRAWDYFQGWSREQIEHFQDEVAYGHRPTWTMSSRIGADAGPSFTNEKLRDAFFKMMGEEPPKARKPEPRGRRREREALSQLDLEPGATLADVKAQYKKLVKKYHPDVNRGDKKSEETFKRITAAYTLLSKSYGTPA